jgi:gliding motility-associated-like protein
MKHYLNKLLRVYVLLIVFILFSKGMQCYGQCNVSLPKDFIECNNSAVNTGSNIDYLPAYSTSNAGDTYLWKISGGPYSYFGGTDSLSRYPKINYGSGYVYTIALQFKNASGTCVDTQVVYRLVGLTAQIVNPLQPDTTVCANTTSLDLSGIVKGPYTSLLWSTSGSGSFSATNALSTKYTFSLADKTSGAITIIFKGTAQTNGSCFPDASDTVTIRFNPAGAKDSAIAFCSGVRLNYQPTTVQAGTYYNWISQVISGNASGNTPSGTGKITDSLINNSSSTDAVVKYLITPINGLCSAPPVYYQVTLKPRPVAIAADQVICTGSSANISLSSTVTGSLYTWTSTVLSGTVTGNSNATSPVNVTSIKDVLINNGPAPASVKYTITPYSPFGCAGQSVDVIVSVVPTVTPAKAGADRNVCLPDSIHLNAAAATNATGAWRQLSGPSTSVIAEPGNPSTAVTNLVGGTYSFIWTVNNGVCPASNDTVSIFISVPVIRGMLPGSATACAGSNAGSFTLSNYTGSILRWEYSNNGGASWTTIGNTTNVQPYANLTTTTWYRAIVASGACGTLFSDTAIVTVNQPVTPANAGADRIMCLQDSIQLSGNSPTSGTGSWRQLSGPTTTIINQPNDPNTSVSNLQPGTYKFIWTISNGVCPPSSDTVAISISTPSFGGSLTGNTTVCASTNSGIITLGYYIGNPTKWEYSTDNGLSWASINNTGIIQSYNNLTTTTWYRATVQSGVCAPAFSDIAVITVNQPVRPANAGADRIICLQDSIQLSGNSPASGTGNWRQLSGPTTTIINQPNDRNTSVSNLQPGTYYFAWTISNGVCPPSSDTVAISISAPSLGGKLTGNATVCGGSNSGIITLGYYIGKTKKWEYSTDSGVNWTGMNNTTDAYTYNNLTTTTWYRAIVQSGVCATSYSDTAIVTVYQPVTPANAGADRIICLQDSIHLNGNTPTSGTGSWRQLSGPTTTTISSVADADASVSNLQAGTYNFIWTISNGVCPPSSDTVAISISAPSLGGKLTGNATVCANSNSGIITLGYYIGKTKKWEYSTDSGVNWTGMNNTTDAYTYNNLTTTTWYRATVQSGVCATSYSDTAIVTMYQPVTPANAGADRIICLQDSIHLNGNTPTSGTGSWRQLSGPTTTTITSAIDADASVSNLQPGTYYFIWTISNGVCPPSSDTVAISISTPSVGGKLTGNATVCSTSNGGAITLSNNTGNIVKWEASTDNGQNWNSINNATKTYTYNNLTTTTWYRATVQSGVCAPAYSDTVIITVFQPVTLANAGADRIICLQDSIHLDSNTPTSGTGSWRQLSGPTATVISQLTDPNASVTNLQAGAYKFIWTISNGVCQPSSDTVIINISTPSVGGKLAGNATVCSISNGGAITLSNNTGNIVKWEASTDNGQSWNSINNNTNAYTYNNLSTTTWYRATVQSGVCSPAYSDTAIITVYQTVTRANAGLDRIICLQDSIHLNGNTPTIGTGGWRQLSGPTTTLISQPNDTNTSVSNLQPGTYNFIWTISNGVCAPSSDTVAISISTPSVGGKLTGTATVCASSNAGTITLSNNTGNIMKWEASTDNGQSWNGINNTTNTYTYNSLTTTTWYRATVQSGVCSPAFSDTVVITVLQAVTPANAGADRIICLRDSIHLNGNTPTSGTGSWRQISGTTSVIGDASNPSTSVTNLQSGTYYFIWTINNGVCPPSSDTVAISISTPSVAGKLTGSATVCASSNTGTITLSNNTGNIVKWEASTDNGQSWNSINNTTNTYTYNNLSRTTWYRVAVQSGVCSPTYSDTAIVTVFQPVTPANAGADRTICVQDSIHLNGNTPRSGTGSWRQLSGPTTTTITSVTDADASVSNLQPGTYYFVWTIDNGVCAPSSDTVAVSISTPSVGGKLTGSTTVCASSNTGTITLSDNTGNIVKWETSTDNGQSWNSINNTTNTYTYNSLTRTTWYRATVQSGVCSAAYSDTAIVTVFQPVTLANAGADRTICLQDSIHLKGNMPISGAGSWKQISGPTTTAITQPTDENASVTNLEPGAYSFVWTVSNGVCSSSSDTVMVIITTPITNVVDTAAQTVCKGLMVTINNKQVTGGDGTYQYQWEMSYDGSVWTNIPNAIQPTYTFAPDSSIYLRRTILSGPCGSVSDIVKIVVQSNISSNTIQANQSICLGENAADIIGSLPNGGNGIYAYIWQKSIDGGNTWTSIANAIAKDFNPGVISQNTLFRRTVISGACVGSYTSVSNPVLITVNPHSKAGFNSTASLSCAPFVIDSSVIKTDRHDDLNKDYLWYANDKLVGTGSSFPGYILKHPQDSVRIKLNVTSLFGCKDDSTEQVFYVVPLPQTMFTLSDTVGCGPLAVNFNNQTPSASQYRFVWDFGNGQSSINQQPGSITFVPSAVKTDTTYIIKLTAYNNCDTVTTTKQLHVRSKPAAMFTASPLSGCSPLTVNLSTFINSTNSITQLYFGDGSDTLIGNSSQFSDVYTTRVTNTFNATLIAHNECGADTSIVPITVIASDARLLFDVIDSAGCAPHRVRLVNHSAGTVSYTWNLGDGTPIAPAKVSDTVYHVYNTPGIYTVQLNAHHQCGDTSAVHYVYVHEVPKANFSATSLPTCIGHSITFANTGTVTTNYLWNFSDGTSSTATNPSHSFAASGNYTVWQTAIQKYSTGVSCIDSISHPVTIVDHQQGKMLVSDTAGTCLPFSVTFINTTQPSASTNWNFGDGTTATGNTVTHIYSSGGTFIATMFAQSPGGCIYRDTAKITVTPPDGSLVYDGANYCGDNTTRFGVNTQFVDSLIWHFGDGTILYTTDSVVSHSYKPGAFLPWVELIGKSGCSVIVPGAEAIRVEQLQTGFTANPQKDCGVTNVQFTDTTYSYFGITQSQWSFGDGTFASGKTVQHQYNKSGTYKVRLIVTSALGCIDTITKPVDVVVFSKPKASIQSSNSTCVFSLLQFTANAISVDSVASYKWNMGNGKSLEGKSVSTTYATAGSYTVNLIAGTVNGCYDTASVSVVVHPLPVLTTTKQYQLCRGQQQVLHATNGMNVTWRNDQGIICSNCNQTTVTPTATTKYYVSGTNQYGCSATDTVVVNVIQRFNMRTSPGDTVCLYGQTGIYATGATTYSWSPSDGLNRTDIPNPVARPLASTNYRVIGKDSYGCFADTGRVSVVVGTASQVRLGSDTVLMAGSSIIINANTTGPSVTKYTWTSITPLSCSTCPSTIATIRNDACITCTVTNMYGCKTSDTICIKTFCKSAQVFIPNAFSPDGDGVNDIFYVMGTGIKIVKTFRIFNRWGELIFEKLNFNPNEPAFGWDGSIRGQKASPEIFVYLCDVVCENDIPYTYKGNVAIIK